MIKSTGSSFGLCKLGVALYEDLKRMFKSDVFYLGLIILGFALYALFTLTPRKAASTEELLPSPGEVWRLDLRDENKGCPWEKSPTLVHIMEVKEGWVKYKFLPGTQKPMFSELKIFTTIYFRVRKPTEEVDDE